MSDSYLNIAYLAKALGDPNRLFILERLSQGPCSVEHLAQKTGLPLANLSHHLQLLKQVGLVNSRRNGRQIIYSHPGVGVIKAIQGLKELQETLNVAVNKISNQKSLVEGPKVSRTEALRLIKEGRALFLDVRPLDEFNAGHIRGAIHIPLDELESRIQFLPKDKLLVAYCRGPYCQLSIQATEALNREGMSASPLEDGYPEWWAEGNPVEALDPP